MCRCNRCRCNKTTTKKSLTMLGSLHTRLMGPSSRLSSSPTWRSEIGGEAGVGGIVGRPPPQKTRLVSHRFLRNTEPARKKTLLSGQAWHTALKAWAPCHTHSCHAPGHPRPQRPALRARANSPMRPCQTRKKERKKAQSSPPGPAGRRGWARAGGSKRCGWRGEPSWPGAPPPQLAPPLQAAAVGGVEGYFKRGKQEVWGVGQAAAPAVVRSCLFKASPLLEQTHTWRRMARNANQLAFASLLSSHTPTTTKALADTRLEPGNI